MADKDEAAASEPVSDDADLPAELAGATDEEPTDDELEPAELEPVGAGVGAGATRSASRKAAPSPKGTPTARRDATPDERRTSPATFVRQSVGELRKVVYPTGQQLGNYFVVVLVFVLFIIAFVSLLDLGLGKLVFALFS